MTTTYAAVAGFFVQDDSASIALADHIGPIPDRFGLIDDSPDRWTRLRERITKLNEDGAANGDSYKLFFLGRHGQGWHNVAESKYGTAAWDDYWSKLNGDGTITWGPDPLLTPIGIEQARAARAAWAVEVAHGLEVPERHFSSPLKRALDTWKIVFSGEDESGQVTSDQRRVLILENCREEYGEHTCDLRLSLTHLRALYPPPTYAFEDNFTEEDLLWTADERETKAHVAGRARAVLDVCFSVGEHYVSIVAHGGFINGFLASVGRASYPLPTGGILPVVVKRSSQRRV